MSQKLELFRVKPSLRRVYFFAVLYMVVCVNGYSRLQQVGLGENLPVISVGLLIVLLVYAHLARFFMVYTINEEFIESRSGIIARNGVRVPFHRITDFAARQGLLQRILGLASVSVSTAGSSGAELVLRNLTRSNAARVIDELTRVTKTTSQAAAA